MRSTLNVAIPCASFAARSNFGWPTPVSRKLVHTCIVAAPTVGSLIAVSSHRLSSAFVESDMTAPEDNKQLDNFKRVLHMIETKDGAALRATGSMGMTREEFLATGCTAMVLPPVSTNGEVSS